MGFEHLHGYFAVDDFVVADEYFTHPAFGEFLFPLQVYQVVDWTYEFERELNAQPMPPSCHRT